MVRSSTMLPLLRAAPFALLFLLGTVMVMTRWRRAAVHLFIVFFLAVSVAAGFGQRDLWPFSAYPVIAEQAGGWRLSSWFEVRVVDAGGREGNLDPSPLGNSALSRWIARSFFQMDAAHRDDIARRLLATRCSNDSILGPLAAPDWLLQRGRRIRGARKLLIYHCTLAGRSLAYEYPSQ